MYINYFISIFRWIWSW